MNRPVTDELLRTVAALRAAGRTWDAIAAEVQRPAKRLRNWPSEHAARWQRYFAASEAEQSSAAAAESRTVLANLLRDEDTKTIKDAASTLLRFQTKRPTTAKRAKKPASAAAVKLAEYVEGLSDADIETHLRELDAIAPADAAAVPPAAASDAVSAAGEA